VQERLLPRIFGFELLMAPYAIAHLKLGLFLEDTGYEFSGSKRLEVYLTNALDQSLDHQPELGFEEFIAAEGTAALAVKQTEVMVVIGNPPYSGHSANNRIPWISEKIRDYYLLDGIPLNERNTKWLQDDYVKFIRFGQWRINETKQGILSFISNHGYLDNPTFRGMRQNLDKTFDEIYVLDLHGNIKKREVSKDGSKDENVFDIQQGTSICFLLKM
jgi:predicted helicase